jgi:hypothetical protein
VKKQSAKQVRLDEKPEVSHLDTTLTEITATAAEGLKKWRTPLIGALIVVFAGAIVYSILSAYAESQEKDSSERVYRLLQSPAAQKDDYNPDKAEIERLLQDVKGKRPEQFVLKSVVELYVGKADRIARKAADAAGEESKKPPEASTNAASGSPDSSSKEGLDPATKAQMEDYRDQALKIVAEAAARFQSDADIQSWATRVKAKIEGDRKTAWLPARWKYTIPRPPAPPLPSPPHPTPPPESAESPAAGPSSTPSNPEAAK